MRIAAIIDSNILVSWNKTKLYVDALVIHPSNGKIVYVGESSVAQELVATLYSCLPAEEEEEEEYVVLRGKHYFIYPGLIDAHIHIEALGNRLYWPDLSRCTSALEARETLEQFWCNRKPSESLEYLLAYGWNDELWSSEDRIRWNADFIDESPILQGIAVFLYRRCLHVCLLNKRAMEMVHSDAYWRALQETSYVRRDSFGRLTGWHVEKASFMIQEYLPSPSIEERAHRVDQALKHVSTLGITSVQTNDANDAWKVYHYLWSHSRDGDLCVRVYLTPMWEEIFDPVTYQPRQTNPEYLLGNPYLRWGRVKLFMDGSLGAKTASLLEPYKCEEEENCGILFMNKEECIRKVSIAMESGWQCETHAIGDRAVEVISQVYAICTSNNNNNANYRPVLTHAQLITPLSLQYMKQSKTIANIQPSFVSSDCKWIESRIGAERISFAYAWKTMDDFGILLSGGSDAPVEDASPWKGIYAAVERKDEDNIQVWQPKERLSLEKAFLLYTENAAFAEYSEHEKGSLEVGYYADMIVLEQNILSIPTLDIRNMSVIATIVGGKVVYARQQLVVEERRIDASKCNQVW